MRDLRDEAPRSRDESRPARRHGTRLATRPPAAVAGHLLRVERLHRVEILRAVENTASRAIPERLGCCLEGGRWQGHWITTRFLDHAACSLLEDEWRAGCP